MKISSRFTVAVHTLLVIHIYGSSQKVTSDFIAASVRVNPVVIRRALLSLKAAGMVEVKAGSGGASIVKPLEDITLYDIYVASDAAGTAKCSLSPKPQPRLRRGPQHSRRSRRTPCRRAARL